MEQCAALGAEDAHFHRAGGLGGQGGGVVGCLIGL
jgi:hypothetical protein